MSYILSILLVVCSLQIANAKSNGVVLKTFNTCTLDNAVDYETIKSLKDCLTDKVALRASKKYPIYLVVDSPGGSVYEGMRFIQFAKSIPNLKTVTIFAASMAAGIVQMLPGERIITEEGVMMFHRASGSFRGQFSDGEIESRLRLWKQIVGRMEQRQADRIGISLEKYKKLRKDEWWVYSESNVEQNTADRLSVVSCSPALSKKKVKKTTYSFFGVSTEKVSACPL